MPTENLRFHSNQPEAAVIATFKLFGFARVSEDMREEILQAISRLIAKQKLRKEGQVLNMI